jgi:hypothetical protein
VCILGSSATSYYNNVIITLFSFATKQDQKLGIGMKTTDGVVVISNIVEDGMFANTQLKVGMEVKTVNNTKVSNTSEAISMLKEATGQVTIVADDEPSTPPASGAAAAAAAASHNPGDAPPKGVESGGQWGTNKYIGSNTQALACVGCLCFCLPGLILLMCPIDERDVYKSKEGNKIYDAAGQHLGQGPPGGKISFVPKRTMHR